MKETRSLLLSVNGLRAGNIDRENREPTIEGLQEVTI
jgi:hypothetical protein